MRGRSDVAGFIAGFAGDDRYIVDYLVEEVLRHQPAPVRSFLLRTSILDRLTGSLCDAVTGDTGGKATLEALDRDNLFVIALDDRRRWYRYHHLFADVLRARLAEEQPELVAVLNGRASGWFERDGDQAEAIRHALAAGDVSRAADLIEVAAHALRQGRQELTLRRWLDALPDSVFDDRPMLAIAHVGALLASGEVAGVERRLAQAERWIPAARDAQERAAAVAAGMVVRHADAFGHLPSAIALYRAGLARRRGDLEATITNARAVLELAGPDQPLERGGAAGLLALACWTGGDLDAAHAAWTDAVTSLRQAGHLADVLGCSIALADIRIAQGRLLDARRTYEDGLRLGAPAGAPPLRGTADMHVGLGELFLEWNDIRAARRHVETSMELGEALGLPQNPYRQRVALARIRAAEGDLEAAIELLDDAERRYDGDFFPEVRPIPALRARVWLAQGRLADARAWAGRAGVAPGDALTYLRELDHITLARLLVAEGVRDRAGGSLDAAIELAERLLAAAEAGGRSGSAIDILAVLALARQARGDRAGAVAVLDRALTLAAPEGYVRVFVGEGEPMATLLRLVAGEQGSGGYARELLAAMATDRSTGARQPLPEPLSDRELEVLRLLQGELDGPGIARELFVSVNTLRTHTKSIYAKLGVSSRRSAVLRATELGLLPNPGDRRPSA
jgi:LuxR family transcriptional regulator, maltose regulon positive regulatory protein